jgi:hypothetical protein
VRGNRPSQPGPLTGGSFVLILFLRASPDSGLQMPPIRHPIWAADGRWPSLPSVAGLRRSLFAYRSDPARISLVGAEIPSSSPSDLTSGICAQEPVSC